MVLRFTDMTCTFYNDGPETLIHLLYSCLYTIRFWREMEEYILSKTGHTIDIKCNDVMNLFFYCTLKCITNVMILVGTFLYPQKIQIKPLL